MKVIRALAFLAILLWTGSLAAEPNEPNVEVVSESTVGSDIKLVYIQPHAHLRGKDFEISVVYPSGEKETVFKGKFDFNWQLGYDLAKPLLLPKGTKIVSVAHYDNSANNPYNPDPTKRVLWGPQNWDEMQSVFLGFIMPLNTDISTVLKASGPSLLPVPKTAALSHRASHGRTGGLQEGHPWKQTGSLQHGIAGPPEELAAAPIITNQPRSHNERKHADRESG